MASRSDHVLFGAAYYHEYQPTPRLDTDLDLMAAADFSVIRVGESVWTTWEPEDGVFDLDWLAPVLDGAHARGIDVILGTPTYAAPPWLARKYPEIAGESSTGVRVPWGGRQEIDYTHPAFLFHAERVIRKIVARYADHPAVIGFQVDNEPGIMLFHNHAVFQRFVDELRTRYGTPERLNEAWGLVYWSHKLSTWADLWTPDGNYQPQYDLAWRTFQAKLTTEFIAWQAGIVREYAREDQFVTTCIAYDRATVDDSNLTRALDVTAGNPYYAMQDALAVPYTESKPQGWTTAGAWTLFQSGDRMFSSKQAPYLITETNAGAIGGPSINFPAYDGQWRQAAWAFIARGAEMIEYWHWHTNHFGTETYWIGILPHDQQPGRVYRQLAQLGSELKAAGSAVLGLKPDARVGMVYSSRSKWGLAFQSTFTKADSTFVSSLNEMDERSYQRIFEAYYRGAFEAGVPVRIIHDDQLVSPTGGLDPAAAAAELPVLVVAGLLVADDELLDWLRNYAAAGGHLVLGIRTAYGDEEGRARIEVKPALLADAGGVRYQEFSNLNDPVTVRAVSDELKIGPDSHASRWVDCLISEGAEVLAEYDHPHFGQFPAITTTGHGRGRITTVGTVPDQAMASDLLRWLVPDARTEWGELPASVTVSSATTSEGGRLHVVHNWSWTPQAVTPPMRVRDVLAEGSEALDSLQLGPWDVRVLLELADGA
ncbi:beta-galactosidase [Microlunatus panaciterrae]|uniref:beta-galactosidase n=1 Tax=Microlunatus panaciterrae TaxID=400768 RepID=A0ABS2RI89_9ACTN|nr:beta-galactosidase [Microlunatus panaciterrae]MBM7798715.1 beta-galactosidase [Microlunatus panaciterrae]